MKYGGQGPISVRVEGRDGWAVLRVHDDGPGIPPEEIARVFERFVQGSGAKNSGGLGLGLYITRKIVEAHGGRIRVDSGVSAGTTFSVELPCGSVAVGDVPIAEKVSPPTPAVNAAVTAAAG